MKWLILPAPICFSRSPVAKLSGIERTFRFTHPNAYDLKHVGDMPATCPVCGQDLRGARFYFGAAYVSYALMVGLMIITAAIFYLVMGGIGDYIWTFLGIATAVAILTTPLVFRYSRVIFLYICVSTKACLRVDEAGVPFVSWNAETNVMLRFFEPWLQALDGLAQMQASS